MDSEDRGEQSTAARLAAPLTPPPQRDDGVDVTLIRWMLSMTPRERLLVLQSNVRSLLRLLDARSRR